MRRHLAWPHIHSPVSAALSAGSSPPSRVPSQHRQAIGDYLAVAAVVLLILATVTVLVLYVVQQAPHWRAGEVGGFDALAPVLTQEPALQAEARAPQPASVAGSGLGRVPLVLVSTAIEMGIFVALGLYLRHEMNGKSK